MKLRNYTTAEGRTQLEFDTKTSARGVWFEQAIVAPLRLPHRRYRASSGPVNEKASSETRDPPRLNIAIHIVGSRGDVQPFIPIAQLLSRPPYNHRVRICTHPAFQKFVEENGLEFFSIGGDPESLMSYMVKNPGLLPGKESIKAGDIGKRRKEMAEIIHGCWQSCITPARGKHDAASMPSFDNVKELFLADAIIANPPSYAHIHCVEKLGIPLHIVFTMPWSPTHEVAHPLASFANKGSDARTVNFHSYGMMEYLAWQGLGDVINRFRVDTLALDEVSPLWGFILLSRLRVPHSYCWSQALIPKPADWGPHLAVTGFSFLQLASTYKPPQDLDDFLQAGPAPVYIGFGSIVIDEPKKLTDLVLEAVKRAGVRAIISRGWGGFNADDVPKEVYFVGNCPHDWLFQRVSAVVHHGGAGTTAAGIAAGKPTIIVPFFGDQPFWGDMVWRAGAGPKPIPYKELTVDALTEGLRVTQDPEIQTAVKAMQAKIASEDGALNTVRDFHEKLDADRIRCQVHPDQLAIWTVNLNGAEYRLSNRALGVLMNQDVIRPNHCRLAHNIRWDVDEGAEAPLLGVVAASASVVHGLIKSISTFKERLRTTRATPRVRDAPEARGSRKRREGHGMLDLESNLDRHPDLDAADSDKIYRMAEMIAAKRYTSRPFETEQETAARRARRHRTVETMATAAACMRDVLKVSLRAPVTFSYNIANGSHNMASFIMADATHSHKHTRRPIHGAKDGLAAGVRGSAVGFYQMFASLVELPYEGAQTRGMRGAARGMGRALLSFPLNLGAFIASFPGYTLKGLEREVHKRRLSKIEVQIMVIRMHQLAAEWKLLSAEDEAETVEAWNSLQTNRRKDRQGE